MLVIRKKFIHSEFLYTKLLVKRETFGTLLHKLQIIIMCLICSKASNPCDLVVERTSGHTVSQYITALTASTTSLHHQPPKGDLELEKGIHSYPKVICMVYLKRIPATNILILIDLLINNLKVKKVYRLLVLLLFTILYILNFIFEVTFLSILTNHFIK